MIQLPEAFLLEMKEQLKEDYEQFLDSYKQPSFAGLRINTNKTDVEWFMENNPFDLQAVPWIYNGFYYDSNGQIPSKDLYYHCGLYYLQEPSAMTPANRLPIEPGDKVLDLCAAPGGKATELGAKLQGEGCLVANDISASRANGLLKNLELLGISNVMVTVEDPSKLATKFPKFFDKILVDVPCSGEGMFRREPNMVKGWEEKDASYYAPIQRSILESAVTMLKPGGLLLYSTCTFSPKEDEENILWLINEFPDMKLVDIEGYEGFARGLLPNTEKCVRIWPHRMQGEGHFLALLQKEEANNQVLTDKNNKRLERNVQRGTKSSTIFKEKKYDDFWKFLKNCTYPVEENRLMELKDSLYLLPEGVEPLKGIRILRSGLLLGTIKNGRFTPSQAFAMALKKEQYKNCIHFTREDARATKYVKGETIFLEEDDATGWQLVCVDGYPLGWGKANNGSLKNKYAPGWRIS